MRPPGPVAPAPITVLMIPLSSMRRIFRPACSAMYTSPLIGSVTAPKGRLVLAITAGNRRRRCPPPATSTIFPGPVGVGGRSGRAAGPSGAPLEPPLPPPSVAPLPAPPPVPPELPPLPALPELPPPPPDPLVPPEPPLDVAPDPPLPPRPASPLLPACDPPLPPLPPAPPLPAPPPGSVAGTQLASNTASDNVISGWRPPAADQPVQLARMTS
jgi:hypothetical protein